MDSTTAALKAMRRRLNEQAKQLVEERRKICVSLGICDEEGDLTTDYGGSASPDKATMRREIEAPSLPSPRQITEAALVAIVEEGKRAATDFMNRTYSMDNFTVNRAREKAASRIDDAKRLDQGLVTREQLNRENGKFGFPPDKVIIRYDKAKKL